MQLVICYIKSLSPQRLSIEAFDTNFDAFYVATWRLKLERRMIAFNKNPVFRIDKVCTDFNVGCGLIIAEFAMFKLYCIDIDLLRICSKPEVRFIAEFIRVKIRLTAVSRRQMNDQLITPVLCDRQFCAERVPPPFGGYLKGLFEPAGSFAIAIAGAFGTY